MDKQKQMKKMAKIIKESNLCGFACDTCKYKNISVVNECKSNLIAEELYNAGYRKIPENTVVVLTRTEKEERFIDLLIEFDEMGFEPTTLPPKDMSVEEYIAFYKNKLLHTFATAIKNLRKETAEKFAEMVKEYAIYSKHNGATYYSIEVAELDEICKEITEENNG